MASSFGSSDSSSFGSSSDEATFSAINVTPLVDVTLVLLIVFMITAPTIYQSAIHVQLPKAQSGEASDKPPMNFAISKEGNLTFNQESISWDTLSQRITIEAEKAAKQTGAENASPVMISADQATPHGTVIRLMDALRQAGLTRFAMSVESRIGPK